MTTATSSRSKQPYPAVFTSYEDKRPQLVKWVQVNYVDEFSLKPGTLLDAGCGEGFWADIFADMGFESYGFDIEPEYIANGVRKYPRVQLQVADILSELPYAPASFDTVFARTISFFYSYRLTQMREALKNLLPLVKYGGTLLVSAYSDGSGEKREGSYGRTFWHHSHEKFIQVAQDVGVVTHASSAGKYIQIGLRS
jgi:SAM-dependent methyltransferase